MISIVIPNFNDSRIERTLESILAQKNVDYEIIIQEGCVECNNTRLIYERYISNRKVNVYIEQDKGIFDAFNRGITRSSGDYIYLIGADDYLLEHDSLERVNKVILDSCPDIVSIGCKMFNGENLVRDWKVIDSSVDRILKGDLPPHLGLFISRKVYAKIGLFDWQNYYDGCDSLWLLKLAMKAPNTTFSTLGNISMAMEVGGHSTGSVFNIIKANWNLYRYSRELRVSNPIRLVLNKLIIKIIQIL